MQQNKALPKVSIIIPVYNGANYLAQAIDSALSQTYANIEIIVVNDGSTDGGLTETICLSYGEKIRYLPKANGGVSSALNHGIEKMEGEYFSWLSHDDIYYPEKIEKQIEYILARPGVRIVGSGLDVIDQDGNKVGNYIPAPETIVRNGRDVMDTWVYGCALLIDRTVFDDVGGFNLSNRTVQDMEMWLDMASHGIRFYFLQDILCQWRKHESSGSFAGRKKHFDEVEQLFGRLLSQYSLAFFRRDDHGLNRRAVAEVYDWLGEQARHRGAVKKARDFFFVSWIKNPNPLHTATRRRLRKFISYLIPRDASREM